jgi:hypothetical protein
VSEGLNRTRCPAVLEDKKTMKTIRSAVVVAMASVLWACSGEDGGTGRRTAAAEGSGPTMPTASVAADGCEPGDSRECRFYYVAQDGRVLCPMKTQYCKSDGSGWLPCGDPPEVGGQPESATEHE